MKHRLIKKPLKRLGQNFLNDPEILGNIVDAAAVTKDDTVIEIGPGYGTLTELLAGRAGRVIAIEIDAILMERLKKKFQGQKNVEIVYGDVIEYPFEDIKEPFKIVANPPYYLSNMLLYKLIETTCRIVSATLTLQKEVAERITARVSTKSYGAITVYYNLFANSQICFKIDREFFYPVPDVDSAVLKTVFLEEPKYRPDNLNCFFKIVSASFSHRRKTLTNSLEKSQAIKADRNIRNELESIGIDPMRRGETLTLEEFVKLSNHFTPHMNMYKNDKIFELGEGEETF